MKKLFVLLFLVAMLGSILSQQPATCGQLSGCYLDDDPNVYDTQEACTNAGNGGFPTTQSQILDGPPGPPGDPGLPGPPGQDGDIGFHGLPGLSGGHRINDRRDMR